MNENQSNKRPPFYFYIITLLVPVALFSLAELGLRAAGVGKDLPLFIETPEFESYYYVNPNIIERYVGDKSRAPKVAPDTTFFKKEKPASTFRIFVQGGSTAAGFPYGRSGSLQGMLYQRFKRLYPDRKIEIISTAMAAVNTYTLLDFVDEIIQQKPDLVLIYAGHNEFLGVMGVGSKISSSSSRLLTLALIKARKLRLFQALELLVYDQAPASPTTDKRTLMSKVVKDTSIPLGSEQYQAGVSQFRANLTGILEKYEDANIPVAIANLVSNEQHQAPFSAIEMDDWNAYQSSIELGTAQATLNALLEQPNFDKSATLNYKAGLIWFALDEFDKARDSFIKARDLDELRFRAPSEFNDIIATVASKHSAAVVDVEQLLLDDSDNKILGNQHLLEHVHPNERGYFLIAEAFVDYLQRPELLGTPTAQFSRTQAWADNPITKVERLNANYVIEKLLNDYPFVSTPKEVAPPPLDTLEAQALSVQGSGIDWRDYRIELMHRYEQRGDLAEAARVAAGTSDAIITDAEVASNAGQRYMQLKDYPMARYYYQRATRLAADNQQYWLGLAEVYFNLGEQDKSEEIISMLKRSKRP